MDDYNINSQRHSRKGQRTESNGKVTKGPELCRELEEASQFNDVSFSTVAVFYLSFQLLLLQSQNLRKEPETEENDGRMLQRSL